MANHKVAILAFCAMALFWGSASVNAQVPPTLFDLHMTGGVVNGEPWPVDHFCLSPPCDGFAGVSLWDSAIPWTVLNPAPDVYNWRFLDIWMNHAAANNVDLLYTFGDTRSGPHLFPTICTAPIPRLIRRVRVIHPMTFGPTEPEPTNTSKVL